MISSETWGLRRRPTMRAAAELKSGCPAAAHSPRETRAYVKIITGQKAEAWTDEESTVYMPTDLPQQAPCDGIGGLSRRDQIAAVNVDLTPSASALVRKAEADEAESRKSAI